MAIRHRFRPFRPYVTPRSPAGTYDPNIDAARAAAGRGIRDVRQDVGLAGERAGQDYQFSQDSYNLGYGRTTEDINRGFGYQQADYNTATAALKRQYDILAGRQQEQANTQGVISGGALLEAAAKRQANQGIEQGGLDTQLNRAREGRDVGLGRATQDRDIGLGRASVEYGRGVTDRTTTLTRAERENKAYGLDLTGQMNYQAAQGGYSPPQRGEPGGQPRNEFRTASGQTRRRIIRGGIEYIVAPDGRVISHRRAR